MTAAMGVGAVIGGLWVAGRGKTGLLAMVRSPRWCSPSLIAVAAVAPNLRLELDRARGGRCGERHRSCRRATRTLQLAAAPQMRGRVMALWSVAFLGLDADRRPDRRRGRPVRRAAVGPRPGRGGLCARRRRSGPRRPSAVATVLETPRSPCHRSGLPVAEARARGRRGRPLTFRLVGGPARRLAQRKLEATVLLGLRQAACERELAPAPLHRGRRAGDRAGHPTVDASDMIVGDHFKIWSTHRRTLVTGWGRTPGRRPGVLQQRTVLFMRRQGDHDRRRRRDRERGLPDGQRQPRRRGPEGAGGADPHRRRVAGSAPARSSCPGVTIGVALPGRRRRGRHPRRPRRHARRRQPGSGHPRAGLSRRRHARVARLSPRHDETGAPARGTLDP